MQQQQFLLIFVVVDSKNELIGVTNDLPSLCVGATAVIGCGIA